MKMKTKSVAIVSNAAPKKYVSPLDNYIYAASMPCADFKKSGMLSCQEERQASKIMRTRNFRKKGSGSMFDSESGYHKFVPVSKEQSVPFVNAKTALLYLYGGAQLVKPDVGERHVVKDGVVLARLRANEYSTLINSGKLVSRRQVSAVVYTL